MTETTALILDVLWGAILGDFLVALFHWFEDTYLPYTQDPSILGQIARDNEMHHFLPYTITAYTPIQNISIPLALSLSFMALVFLVAPKWSRTHWALLITAGIVGSLSNLLHRYIHERPCRRPRLITTLQDAGVLVSSSEHAKHHTNPQSRYGVVLGFTNVIYDNAHIWRLFEMVVPLQKYPKPGVSMFQSSYDEWTLQNMERECPEKLSEDKVKDYMHMLEDYHQTKL
jgi:Lipid desaturase domain